MGVVQLSGRGAMHAVPRPLQSLSSTHGPDAHVNSCAGSAHVSGHMQRCSRSAD